MALPGAGTISLSDIYYEFPGTIDDPVTAPPIGLDEYYRGGTYVPYISANYGIPTSGTIAFNNFYNGVGYFNLEQTWSGGVIYNYNLNSQLISAGWDSVKPVYAKITISSTSNFISPFSTAPACYIGDLPLGSTVILTIASGARIEGQSGLVMNGGIGLLVEFSNTRIYNYGTIYGGAGKGGRGQGTLYDPNIFVPGETGGNGGHALYINIPALRGAWPSIYNYGAIAGGGGGGGGGGQYCIATSCSGTPTFCANGGGGGGGRGGPLTSVYYVTGGDGGQPAGYFCSVDGPFVNAGAGQNGAESYAGAGGAGGQNSGARGGDGGNGGDFGQNGNTGGIGYGGGAGGAAKLTYSGTSTTVVQGATYGAWT